MFSTLRIDRANSKYIRLKVTNFNILFTTVTDKTRFATFTTFLPLKSEISSGCNGALHLKTSTLINVWNWFIDHDIMSIKLFVHRTLTDIHHAIIYTLRIFSSCVLNWLLVCGVIYFLIKFRNIFNYSYFGIRILEERSFASKNIKRRSLQPISEYWCRWLRSRFFRWLLRRHLVINVCDRIVILIIAKINRFYVHTTTYLCKTATSFSKSAVIVRWFSVSGLRKTFAISCHLIIRTLVNVLVWKVQWIFIFSMDLLVLINNMFSVI